MFVIPLTSGAISRRFQWRNQLQKDHFQFYPTPMGLAKRAWEKFANRSFTRILEPSAGSGSMIAAFEECGLQRRFNRRDLPIDAIELDLAKHALLREMGANVVGLDFLSFTGGEVYSHVIMNPPFATGATHVLKAWDMLWAGEVVAILNAETLRNPFSHERQRLLRLVDEHGSVEFISDAFVGGDVEREADVDVALVHLVKREEQGVDWFGGIMDNLAKDPGIDQERGSFELPTELALPASFVETQCRSFRAAVRASREAIKANSIASRFACRIGESLSARNGQSTKSKSEDAEAMVSSFAKSYDDLKDRAWASVLRSTETLSRLSAKVQRSAEGQFETIKKLEFTESNVYGFLLGLVESQPEMQADMMCDVFDQITRYHSENTVFYRGWKSNDKHRTCGLRIKITRFILPGFPTESYSSSLPWAAQQLLSDFDKVFAMLDGKSEAPAGLLKVATEAFGALRSGKRVSSSYFDLRYYPGIGTLHFFARDKALVDRLNRFVGARRGWLPPEGVPIAKEFWLQYQLAEKLDPKLRREVQKTRRSRWDDPFRKLFRDENDIQGDGDNVIADAIDTLLAEEGLLAALTYDGDAGQQPLLLEAA